MALLNRVIRWEEGGSLSSRVGDEQGIRSRSLISSFLGSLPVGLAAMGTFGGAWGEPTAMIGIPVR